MGVYLASFSVVYFNVALAAAANDALAGRDPDVAAARAVSRKRIGAIAGWAAVTVAVSALLAFIRDRAGSAGDLLAAIGGAIWGLVTFLVIQVLAFEGIGPIASAKRSADLFRDRWGQQITGDIAIGGIAGLVIIVGVLIGVGGIALLAVGGAAAEIGGALLFLVAAVVTIGATVFSGATRGVFGVALYHYIADEATLGPFSGGELESAVATKQ